MAEHAELLDATFREVTAGPPENTAVRFDDAARLHLSTLPPEAEPPNLADLRVLTNRMLPRADLSEVLLEVVAWTRRGSGQPAGASPQPTGGVAELSPGGPDIHRQGLIDVVGPCALLPALG